MPMSATTSHWTATDLRALPDDGNRYEIVDGELLVTPAPSWAHQRAVRELLALLRGYLHGRGIAAVLPAPADVELAEDTVVEPDLFVVPLVAAREPAAWRDVRRLLLAVEIVSPRSARADRWVKRRHYQRAGVPEYWIVDIDAEVVERWRPEDERPEVIADTLEWAPDPAQAPLAIDLAALFAVVAGR